MARIKSELQELFQADGILNCDDLELIVLEREEGLVDITEALKRVNGKDVRITIAATSEVEVPFVE